MREAVALGWRLCTRASGHGRIRSAIMLLVASTGTLAVLAIAAAVRRMDAAFDPVTGPERPVTAILLSGFLVLAVVLPVVAIALSSGRMSAATRRERAARLRLLGVSGRDVAAASAAESAPWALGGWGIGLALAAVVSSVVPVALLTGSALLISAAVPASIIAGACTVRSARRSSPTATARGPVDAPVRLLWVAPLVMGLLALGGSMLAAHDGASIRTVLVLFLGGIVLAAVGTVVLPAVTVRVIARTLLRGGPASALIAARRLQSRPAAMARVFAALLIGLMVTASAQGLVVAFANVPQHRAVEHQRTVQARSDVYVPEGWDDARFRDRVGEIEGVRVIAMWQSATVDVGSLPTLRDTYGEGLPVVVAECADLAILQPGVQGCSDAHAAWIASPLDAEEKPPIGPLPIRPAGEGNPDTVATVDVQPGALRIAPSDTPWENKAEGALFVPRGLLTTEQAATLEGGRATILATPRLGLDQEVIAHGIALNSGWDLEEYRRIDQLLDSIRLLSIAVLGIGMGGFLLLLIDRALERRSEVARLQLAGVLHRTILLAHVLEVLVPLAIGCAAALGVGFAIAQSYVGIGNATASADDVVGIPVDALLVPGVASVLGALVVTAISGLGLGSRVRARDLRRV